MSSETSTSPVPKRRAPRWLWIGFLHQSPSICLLQGSQLVQFGTTILVRLTGMVVCLDTSEPFFGGCRRSDGRCSRKRFVNGDPSSDGFGETFVALGSKLRLCSSKNHLTKPPSQILTASFMRRGHDCAVRSSAYSLRLLRL